jgi:hypothetical protein
MIRFFRLLSSPVSNFLWWALAGKIGIEGHWSTGMPSSPVLVSNALLDHPFCVFSLQYASYCSYDGVMQVCLAEVKAFLVVISAYTTDIFTLIFPSCFN